MVSPTSIEYSFNNNNNNQNDIYGAVIMAKPLQEFNRFIWWMQTQRRGGRQPSDQANRLGLRVHHKEMAATIYIHHCHFSITQLMLILPYHGGWKAESTQFSVCSQNYILMEIDICGLFFSN